MNNRAPLIGGVTIAMTIFLTVVINVQLVRFWLWLLFVPISGFIAGVSLISARSHLKPKSAADFLSYVGIFGAGIVLITLYFWIFSKDDIIEKSTTTLDFNVLMLLTLLDGILAFIGTALLGVRGQKASY